MKNRMEEEDGGVMNLRKMGIRSAFRISILVLGVITFFALAIVSFFNVSSSEYSQAEASVSSEINYLCLQLAPQAQQEDTASDAVGGGSEAAKANKVLEGYTMAETGTVIIVVDGKVLATDDVRLTRGEDLKLLIGETAYNAIDASIETGQMQRVPCENSLAGSDKHAYLMAGRESQYTIVIIETPHMIFKNRTAAMGRVTAVSFGTLVMVFFIVDRLLILLVARRIDETNGSLARITAGDLDVRVPDRGTREFRSLSSGINETVDALKGWIAEAETRMDAELATAKAIQESALPRTFPPYPDISKFDIYASMTPARQVGGDFYDFFLVGDNSGDDAGKLGFMVADVSGKGVPASLFMMKAKAQIRDYVRSGMELGEAVTEANRQLCDGNDEGMFVTAWVGVLDYGTGHVEYVNAGHNPPLLWTRESGWKWMRERSGPMLGLFEVPYHAHSVDCLIGETFLLYTDGVTEAFDVNENLYGEDRLFAVAQRGYRLHPRELLESVREDVAAYAVGAEQSDDITILALEIGVPPEVTVTLEVDARVSELDRVNRFLHAELDRRLCPKRVQNQLDIVVEELFVNVCHYAYPNATEERPGRVRVQRTYSAEPPSITIDIIDEGIAFDPLAKPDAVPPSSIEDASIGGLGILLVKKLVDEMGYERVDGSNVVTVVKKW